MIDADKTKAPGPATEGASEYCKAEPESTALVLAVAAIVRHLGGTVIESDDLGAYAAEYAVADWPVFPLRVRDKIPYAGTHGNKDATTDHEQISRWWDGHRRGSNIGLNVPPGIIVIDVDPRNGGLDSLNDLVAAHGPLPTTLTAASGRRDGGIHTYWRRPAGKLSDRRLGAGIDLKANGYVVLPPSVHPATGLPYRWVNDAPIAPPPTWLVDLIVEPEPVIPEKTATTMPTISAFTDSIADAFTEATTWGQILTPHGWSIVKGDGEADRSAWRRPGASSPLSATVTHGLLFNYSTESGLPVTESGIPAGLTRFRAWAHLDHGGDLKAAARAFRLTGAI